MTDHVGLLSVELKRILLTIAESPRRCIVALIAVYLIVGIVLPPGGSFIADQGVKYFQVEALARDLSVAVGSTEAPLSVFRPSFAGNFYLAIGSHYQAVFSPAYALIALPFYLGLGLRGLVIPSALGSILAAYLSGILGGWLGARYRGAIVLAVGLASPLAIYSFILWEHALGVALIVAAIYLALRSHALASGLLAALAVWLRPEAYLLVPALALAVLLAFGVKAAFSFVPRFVAGYLASALPWWAYNLSTSGTVLGAQVDANSTTPVNRLQIVALYLLPLQQKKWLLLLALVAAVLIIQRTRKRSLQTALLIFWIGAFGMSLWNLTLLARGTGPSLTDVFPFAFASVGSLAWITRSPKLRFLWVLTGCYILGVVLVTPTWGGGGWGPRMLLGIYPLLAILGCLCLEASTQHFTRLAILALLISSVTTQAVGLRYVYTIQTQWAKLDDELGALRPEAVATAVWWLPPIGAPSINASNWYGIEDDGDIEHLDAAGPSFWWIWSNIPQDRSVSYYHPLATVPNPMGPRYRPVMTKPLSTAGLQATLYQAR